MQGAQVQSLVRELDPTYHKKKKKKKKKKIRKKKINWRWIIASFSVSGTLLYWPSWPLLLIILQQISASLTFYTCLTFEGICLPSFPKSKHPLTGEETESHNPDVTCLKLPDIPETALDFLGPWSRMWGGQGEGEQCCLYFESLRDLGLDERVRYLRYLTLGL